MEHRNDSEPRAWQTANLIIVGLAAFALFLVGIGISNIHTRIAEGDQAMHGRLLEVIQANNETRNLVMEMLKVQNRLESQIAILQARQGKLEDDVEKHFDGGWTRKDGKWLQEGKTKK